jgi:hypothetical protein
MVDMAAIASAATALRSAYELSKAALGVRDEAMIRAKVIEMQAEISSALAGAITAQTDQFAALDRVRELEKVFVAHRDQPGGASISLAEVARHLAPDSPTLGDRDPGLTDEGWFRSEHMTYPYGSQTENR